MGRRKKILALPTQAKKDAQTIAGIFDRWSTGVEDLTKNVFSWLNKHKLLVTIGVGLIVIYRYWLGEEPGNEDDEDF